MKNPMLFKKFVETADQPGLEIYGDSIGIVFKDGTQNLDLLSSEAQVIYLAWSFHGEIMNGGFSQYISNDSGKDAIETLHALSILNATEAHELLRRALTVFPESKPSKNPMRRWAQHENWMIDHCDNGEFYEQLNSDYYDLEEFMDRVTDSFARANCDVSLTRIQV